MLEEYDQILDKKGSVAHYFISHLLADYILFNCLDRWLRDNYNLSFDELLIRCGSRDLDFVGPTCEIIYTESMAYGIVEMLSSTTSASFISIFNLVNKVNEEIFASRSVDRLKKYKEAYAKYSSKIEQENRGSLFRETIYAALDTLGEKIEKAFSINPKNISKRNIINLAAYTTLFGTLIKSIEKVSYWVLSLKEENVNKVMEEIHVLAQKNHPEKEICAFLDSYGFGLKYFENIKKEISDTIKEIEFKT